MPIPIRLTTELQVIDLVLDPQLYHDVLLTLACRHELDTPAVNHLAAVLPQAIDQLDAVGDAYGALDLAELYEQIVHSHAMV